MDCNENLVMPEIKSFDEENKVGFQLKTLDHKFRRRMEAEMRNSGLECMSVMNGWILAYLACHDGEDVYQKDLEKAFHVGKSSMAGTLKVMEEKGVVVRQSVKNDARLKRVILTETGKEYMHKLDENRQKMEEIVCAELSEEELALFMKVVKKMQNNLTL